MGNRPNEGGAQKEPAVGLKRTLGLREAITITAGTVIGVGLFTTGGNVVGEMGPFVVLATALAALISIYPALMYGEMGAALPFAGGTYQYVSDVPMTTTMPKNRLRARCASESMALFSKTTCSAGEIPAPSSHTRCGR